MAEPREMPRAAQSVVESCTVTDCTYNENRECHAGEIQIRMAQNGAICATYTPEEPTARP